MSGKEEYKNTNLRWSIFVSFAGILLKSLAIIKNGVAMNHLVAKVGYLDSDWKSEADDDLGTYPLNSCFVENK